MKLSLDTDEHIWWRKHKDSSMGVTLSWSI